MKGKYITTTVLMACLTKAACTKKSIHEQLAETIIERKRIIRQWQQFLAGEQENNFILPGKKAA